MTSGGVDEALDVAVVGGGLAGNLLARQLRRELPALRVGLFERSTERSFKVGESTVEIASHYLIRRCGLTRYLYDHHYPKNGLRYFFDDVHRSADLADMSEIGTVNLPFHPAFQIDRARFEADLLEMNRAEGARVETGVQVRRIELGQKGAPHRFEVRGPDGTRGVRARWLVDAGGRAGLLARAQGLRVREPEHRIGSVWGRFENVADVDARGPAEFRARVRHTVRGLSTIHFWYPGYWIWFIPLRHGITSVGVVGSPATQARIRTADGFRAFLDGHRAVAELLREAKPVDVGSYAQIAYGTRRFFSADRWGLAGEAATAADPLYSPGTDFVALENDYLVDLIRRDGEGQDIARRVELYDGFVGFRHEATMRLYRGLYPALGSYELMRLKWDFDIACYFHLWVSPYMQDRHLDPRFLREQLRLRPAVLRALENFGDLFRAIERHLWETGSYFRANLGRFSYGLEDIDFVEQVGLPQSREEALDRLARIFNGVRRRGLALLGRRTDAEALPDLELPAFMGETGLV